MIEKYMKESIKEAKKAFEKKEVPVGCVIVYNNKIIARAHNLRETKQSSLNHAEILAIQKACNKLKSWRLEDCDIYITLEPCPMCAGAILQSRFKNVYFGAYDKKTGACGSVFNLFSYKFNHEVNVVGGNLEEECSSLLTSFFSQLRKTS